MRNSAAQLRSHHAPRDEPQELAPPHVFRPHEASTDRDLASLFNLRRRPGYYNAAARAALLRRSKQPPHDDLFADFSAADVELSLTAAAIELLAGPWTWQATVNGETLVASEGAWQAVRWQTGKAFDYLEVELPLAIQARSASEGPTTEHRDSNQTSWRLNRQMFLSRDDGFLFLADAILGQNAEPAELRYASSLPLADRVTFNAARDTRDGQLASGRRARANVIVPALPEWRSEHSHGELRADDHQLMLNAAAAGSNLYCPLWIDLDARRLARPLTWRRLSVAENRDLVRRDVAAASRIQAGRQQWLVYRSLSAPANRTVMGYNTLQSFVVARIDAGAAVKEIFDL